MSTNNFNKFLLVSIGFIAAFLLFSLDVNAAIIHKPPTNLGLVGYWSFNEGAGTLATDFSGNGNTGTLTNGPFWVAGKRGKALSFDGSNDYVDTGPTNMPGATSITVALWIYVGASDFDGTVKVVMGDASDPNGSNGFYLALDDRGGGNLTNGVYIELDSTGGVVDVNANNVIGERRWYHIATAYSASTGRIYVDGRDVTSSSVGSGSFIPDTNQNLTIGQVDGGWFTKAIFDEVRIYNRALTLSEVEGLYKSGAVAHKNPSNLGLVGYWSFNEGTSTQAGDSSGNNNGGQLTNGPFWVAGKRGKALSFDGSDDYVNPGDGNSLDVASGGGFTTTLWMKTTDPDGMPLAFRDSTSGNPVWDMAIGYNGATTNAGHFIPLMRYDNNSGLVQHTSTRRVDDGNWHFLALVLDQGANVFDAYVDSAKYSVSQTTDWWLTTNIDRGIGSERRWVRDSYGPSAQYFNGLIDEVRIYNRALSADEIKILYQGSKYATVNASQNTKLTNGLVGFWSFNGPDVNLTHPTSPKAFDRSGQGNDGILTNGPVAAIGKIGQALNFDGSDDYVDMGDLSAIESVSRITIAAWAKPRTLISTGGVFSKTSATAQAFDMLVGAAGLGDTDDVFVRISNGSASEYGYTSSNILSLGTWGYWVLVFDGTLTGNDRLSFYFNGVKQSLTYGATPPSLSGSNTQNANIGRYPAGGAFFNGLIDEVRIYNRALSADEIKRLYNMGR